jgi:DNA primase
MFSIKDLVDDYKEVPTQWIFEHYLSLNEKLTGQHVKMFSVFNPTERTPSMCLFVQDGNYRFKDFSTDKGGGAFDLVCNLYNITFAEAVRRVVNDYNTYVLNNNGAPINDFKVKSRYKVTGHQVRNWNESDKKYWLQFKIGSKLLETFNVKPLSSYTMSKDEEGEQQEIVIRGDYLYGYFSNNGDLCKVYQPHTKTHKFIKVKDYTQGLDQLSYSKPYLVICSSLKDAMCLTKFNYNVEVVAPDSENTIIKPHVIELFKRKYDKVITLFDYDEAGIKSAKKYEELYSIPYAILPMEKDLSDSVKVHGIKKCSERLVPLLREALSLYK